MADNVTDDFGGYVDEYGVYNWNGYLWDEEWECWYDPINEIWRDAETLEPMGENNSVLAPQVEANVDPEQIKKIVDERLEEKLEGQRPRRVQIRASMARDRPAPVRTKAKAEDPFKGRGMEVYVMPPPHPAMMYGPHVAAQAMAQATGQPMHVGETGYCCPDIAPTMPCGTHMATSGGSLASDNTVKIHKSLLRFNPTKRAGKPVRGGKMQPLTTSRQTAPITFGVEASPDGRLRATPGMISKPMSHETGPRFTTTSQPGKEMGTGLTGSQATDMDGFHAAARLLEERLKVDTACSVRDSDSGAIGRTLANNESRRVDDRANDCLALLDRHMRVVAPEHSDIYASIKHIVQNTTERNAYLEAELLEARRLERQHASGVGSDEGDEFDIQRLADMADGVAQDRLEVDELLTRSRRTVFEAADAASRFTNSVENALKMVRITLDNGDKKNLQPKALRSAINGLTEEMGSYRESVDLLGGCDRAMNALGHRLWSRSIEETTGCMCRPPRKALSDDCNHLRRLREEDAVTVEALRGRCCQLLLRNSELEGQLERRDEEGLDDNTEEDRRIISHLTHENEGLKRHIQRLTSEAEKSARLWQLHPEPVAVHHPQGPIYRAFVDPEEMGDRSQMDLKQLPSSRFKDDVEKLRKMRLKLKQFQAQERATGTHEMSSVLKDMRRLSDKVEGQLATFTAKTVQGLNGMKKSTRGPSLEENSKSLEFLEGIGASSNKLLQSLHDTTKQLKCVRRGKWNQDETSFVGYGNDNVTNSKPVIQLFGVSS